MADDDDEDPRAALVELVLELEGPSEEQLLRAELLAMRPSALRKRAAAVGAEQTSGTAWCGSLSKVCIL